MHHLKLWLALFLITLCPIVAKAEKEQCPKKTEYSDLAIEGIFVNLDEMDAFDVTVNVLPGWTGHGKQGQVSVRLETDSDMKAARKLRPGNRVHVTYDMVQEYSILAGECLVIPIAKKMQTK